MKIGIWQKRKLDRRSFGMYKVNMCKTSKFDIFAKDQSWALILYELREAKKKVLCVLKVADASADTWGRFSALRQVVVAISLPVNGERCRIALKNSPQEENSFRTMLF